LGLKARETGEGRQKHVLDDVVDEIRPRGQPRARVPVDRVDVSCDEPGSGLPVVLENGGNEFAFVCFWWDWFDGGLTAYGLTRCSRIHIGIVAERSVLPPVIGRRADPPFTRADGPSRMRRERTRPRPARVGGRPTRTARSVAAAFKTTLE
jgi:hypothetical protein